jgi:hypothetical protein
MQGTTGDMIGMIEIIEGTTEIPPEETIETIEEMIGIIEGTTDPKDSMLKREKKEVTEDLLNLLNWPKLCHLMTELASLSR